MRTLAVVFLLSLGSMVPAAAPETAGAPDELAAGERIRGEVEAVFAELYNPTSGSDRLFYTTSARLEALGSDVVPFLAAELDQPSAHSFNVVAYVLGRLGTAEAREALRKGVARADSDGGKFGAARKVWALYGLALAGDEGAVALLDDGANVGAKNLMDGLSLTELAASLTAPRSVPLLVERLDRYRDDEVNQPRLIYILRALGRIADPSAKDAVRTFLGHERWHLRQESLLALAALDDPSVADDLLAGLSDPSIEVRMAAARAIERFQPEDKSRAILARLETEPNGAVRVPLYHALAAGGGKAMLDGIRNHWGREDYFDRLGIIRAVSGMRLDAALNLFRVAVKDPDAGVAIAAIDALERSGSPGARDALLATLRDPRWAVVEATTSALVRLDERRAAPRVTDLLLRGELAEPVVDHRRLSQIRATGDAIVALRYVEPLDDLRAAARRQREQGAVEAVAEYLDSVTLRLREIKELGDDVARWTEQIAGDDPALRRLAVERLVEIGGAGAHEAVAAFVRGAEPERQVDALRAISRHPSKHAAPLIEEILTAAEFAGWEHRRVRSMAAWAARRTGGDAMVTVLRRSNELRDGLDIDTLVYYAVLAGREAVPMLQRSRLDRFRDIQFQRGKEQKRIDRVLRTLELGRPPTAWDLPPESLALGPY